MLVAPGRVRRLRRACACARAPGRRVAAGEHEDFDARTGTVAPTAEQLAIASEMGAVVRWSAFGTPASLTKHGGFLAAGLSGPDAPTVALDWLRANKALFRLSSTDGLALVSDGALPGATGTP